MNIEGDNEDDDIAENAEDIQNISIESDDTLEAFEFLREQDRVTDAVVQLYADLLDDSDDDSDDDDNTWGGSRPGKAPNKNRDFLGAYKRLVANYFSGQNSIYNEEDFERCFRMPRAVFGRIYQSVLGNEPFVEKINHVSGQHGIHPLVRITACLRHLSYGDSCDREDENLEIAQSTLNMSVKEFTKIIKQQFGAQYLGRCPTEIEKKRALEINAGRGFPGMFASWDCKHFVWKNCPVALAGQHKGRGTAKTLILEAICDADLYIWYHFFGEPGSLNDINVLNKSSIVSRILNGSFNLKVEPYRVGINTRDWMYFLVDGIYPNYSIFIDTIQHPFTEQERYFSTCQEACRKDIERAFGVLTQQFHILQRPFRNWYLHDIVDILDCCVIFHNMIIEFRRENFAVNEHIGGGRRWYQENEVNPDAPPNISLFSINQNDADLFQHDIAAMLAIRVANLNEQMRSANEHFSLKQDLADHLWERHNNNNN